MPKIESKKAEVKKPLTKNQMIANIADTTGLAKKDVNSFLDALTDEIKKSLGKKGAGAFVLPGLFKIDKKQVKAQPAKKDVPNPFRPGEVINRPAKPAHLKVRVRPLKLLKDVVEENL
ncbi:MAG: HU family DNA-binding protein [Planctomycetaceae bacterium]|jgi:nucleoid DNA-binding protein|nr:HU family DNA-binding protein [Planctomycetaceae bacterium]